MIGWDSRDTLSISAYCSSKELEGWKEDSGHLIPFQENPAPLSQAGVHWGGNPGGQSDYPSGEPRARKQSTCFGMGPARLRVATSLMQG